MKKFIALLLALMMLLSMGACGSKEAASDGQTTDQPTGETGDTNAGADTGAETGTDTSSIKVAGIVFQDDQFMNMMTQGFVDAANDAGVEILTDNTNNDQARETELINTYLNQGVQGLAIAPLNGDASVAALRAADEKGMKVALTNIDLADADFIVAGYTSDDYNNCYLAGQEAAEILKEAHGDETLNLAIVQFKSQLPDISANRVQGYLDALTDGGINYEVVADQDAWMQDTALTTASGILTANPDLDVIITVNDGGTIGSTMAVQNANLSDQVMVFGHDGSDQISSMVIDDACPLQAVVAQDPYGQGYKAMTALINAIKGEDYSATKGKTEYLDGIILSSRDKDAVNSWRVDNGFEEIQ